ncbi:hypothetical protein ORJ66_20810, partial [Pseudoalteromonas tunicata]|uniref:hypothetical protein n=1 Tax=Pseudoalteromonas tunicata TaxID=314281 RepID=UPI00273D9427
AELGSVQGWSSEPLHGGYVHIKCIFKDQFAYFLKIWGAGGFHGETGDSIPLAAHASATTTMLI